MTKAQRKVNEALLILRAVDFPVEEWTPKMQARLGRIFLALCNLRPNTPWRAAAAWERKGSWALRTREIIRYINKYYGEKVSPGSYDDIRRRHLQYLVAAGLVLANPSRPDAPANDGTRCYAISPDAAPLLRAYGEGRWKKEGARFLAGHTSLQQRLSRARGMRKLPVKLPGGARVRLAKTPHNELQRQIT